MNAILPLYQPLPTPQEIRLWDEASTITFGIPSLLLMENASREALRVLQMYRPTTAQTRVLIYMGKGNNGGDGVALARHLHDLGCRVLVYHTVPLEEIKGVAGEHLNIALRTGVSFLQASKTSSVFLPQEWQSPDVIVDAILGNGFTGELRSTELSLVKTINQAGSSSFILSLDAPTGLCGLTGKPRPEAVRAHVTVAFEAASPGLYFGEAVEYVGRVHVRAIGMPQTVRDLLPASWRLLSPKKGEAFAPSPRIHKGQAGRVMIIGGSRGMTGAPVLAARAAVRTGAGLVHVACPAQLEPDIRRDWPEIMTNPLGSSAQWDGEAAKDLPDAVTQCRPKALVIGPGMGRTPGARLAVEALLSLPERPPAIIDADALSFFRLKEGKTRRKNTESIDPGLLRPSDILTPHPGEMAKLMPDGFFSKPVPATLRQGDSRRICVEELQRDRPKALAAFMALCPSVCLFKGPGTLIGQKDSPSTILPLETATLAIGGSGDILSGACAALVGQGLSSLDAASLAAYLHGCAGLRLREEAPKGHRASEIADMIPLIWQELQQSDRQ